MYGSAWTLFESEVATLRDVADLHSDVAAELAKKLNQVELQGLKAWTAKCKETAQVIKVWGLEV